jgi:ankyrin repeat protein
MASNVRFIPFLNSLDIWRACRDGELDLVRVIIREGQDVNEQTQYLKNTPLHIAAFNGHYLIVKYLLEQGANPIITNREGLTPLNFAEKSK